MRTPVVPTTCRPNHLALLPRPRLHEVFEGTRSAAVWVTAPAGAGKTCAVVQHLERRGTPALWLDLEHADADPASFFHSLSQAARAVTDREFSALLPEHRHDLGVFAQGFFAELFEFLPHDITLVFDSVERLSGDSAVFDLLAKLISQAELPSRCILISRGAPPEPLGRSRASGALRLVGWEELRFRPEETETFVEAHGRGFEPGLAAELQRATDGWAAGLVLGVRTIAAHLPPDVRPTAGVGEELLFDFLAVEVFRTFTSEEQRMLLAIAQLPEVTSAEACELSGNARAGELLAGLAGNHQLTAVLDAGTEMYRLHSLLRGFLGREAARRLGPVAVRELVVRGGRLLARRERNQAAAALFRTARAWADLALLLERTGGELLRRGQHRLVDELASSLASHTSRVSPRVWYLRSLARLPFDSAQAAELLDRALYAALEPASATRPVPLGNGGP